MNNYYQGLDYMYQGRWNDASNTFINYLKLSESNKKNRCMAMQYIAKCYKNLNLYDKAKEWLEKAINEAPYLKEPYVEMAIYYSNLEDWNKVIYYCHKALKINDNKTIYNLLKLANKYKKHY